MSSYGAEKSANQIYHTWFANGSVWDDATTSIYGPAPGFVPGGPNAGYSGNPNLSPPNNQPLQKSYLDFNSIADASWEITEPGIYYQAAYVRLLSQVMSLEQVSLGIDTFVDAKVSYLLVPNPNTNEVKIASSQTDNITVSVFNA